MQGAFLLRLCLGRHHCSQEQRDYDPTTHLFRSYLF